MIVGAHLAFGFPKDPRSDIHPQSAVERFSRLQAVVSLNRST
jgi:hypothetical protein